MFPLHQMNSRRLLLELVSCTLGVGSSWTVWLIWKVRPGQEQVAMGVAMRVGVGVAIYCINLSYFIVKIECRRWTSCLESSLIVRNGSLLCCAKPTNVLLCATNFDHCYESVPLLRHTSESSRVGGFKFFFLWFVVLGYLIKKVQFGCWTSCLDGSTIERLRSLLGCVKPAKA